MPTPDINNEMRQGAEYAAKVAKNKFGVDLDFSEASISSLEILLVQAGQQFGGVKSEGESPNDAALNRTAMIWGGYLGEMLRKKWGGSWVFREADSSRVMFINDIDFYPINFVYQKITGKDQSTAKQYLEEVEKRLASTQKIVVQPDQGNNNIKKNTFPVERILQVVLGIVALVLLVVVGVWFFSRQGSSSRQAAQQATLTQQAAGMVAAVTQTAQKALSLIPTRTPTHTSAPLTPTPTIYSFKPGDPTATPLGRDINDPNFIAGVAAYTAADYEEAIRLMGLVIAVSPDLAPPYRYRGNAYWYLKDCVSGLADMEKALALDPDYAVAWADRGSLNSCLGNNELGMEDYRKALTIDPSLAKVHHNLGIDYYNLGDYETSLQEYALSIAIDPSRAESYNGMSQALGVLGRSDECIDMATKALEMKPEIWSAYFNRAFCLTALERYEPAVTDYKVYLEHTPDDAIAWYNLGFDQRHSGDLQGAVASNTRALELDPSYYQAYINRGVDYSDLKEYEKAVADFTAALESGDIETAYYDRGATYYKMQKYELAISDFEWVVSVDPYKPSIFCNLATSYFAVGRYQDALDSAWRSHQVDPTCSAEYLLEVQARSSYTLGDYDQALIYINKAMEMEPYTLGYYYRGTIYQALGDTKSAIEEYEVFLSDAVRLNYQGPEIADAKARLKILKP